MGNILQSAEWEKVEKMEGAETFFVEGEGFSCRGVVKNTPVGQYLYAKYGPELATKKDLKRALKALLELAREKKAFFVRIEPTLKFSEAEMKKMGGKRSKEINPAHTWVVDLTKSEEELLSEMMSTKARRWRNAAKRGMTVRKSVNPKEIAILGKFLAETGERDHFTPQKTEHLKRQMEAGFATLFIVDLENENGKKTPIAAVLCYDFDGVRYYAHVAVDNSEKYKKLWAGAVVAVETIIDAKRTGMHTYDFWGVTDSDNPKHPWYGFTQFKKSFGGKMLEYSGDYDFVVDRGRYFFYNLLRKVNLLIRKAGK